LEQACQSHKLSSVHITFCTEDEWSDLGEAGWLQRLGMQFHWENAGYADFEGFLGALSSRKRKVLRRERRETGRLQNLRTNLPPEQRESKNRVNLQIKYSRLTVKRSACNGKRMTCNAMARN
jgi:hypothetical protein